MSVTYSHARHLTLLLSGEWNAIFRSTGGATIKRLLFQ